MFAPDEFDDIARQTSPAEQRRQEPATSAGPPAEPPAEPAKPQDPAPAAAVDDFPEQIQGDAKAQAAWGKLRKRLAEAESKLSEYSAQPAAQQDPAVLKALEDKAAAQEAKLQEYQDLLRVSQIEETDEYKDLVEKPLAAIVVTVEAFAEKYKISEAALLEAFAERDQAVQDDLLEPLLEGFSPRDRNRIYNMIEEAGRLYEKDSEIRANSAVAAQELDARKQAAAAKQEAEMVLALRKANDEVLGVAQAKFTEFGLPFDINEVRTQVDGVRVDKTPPQQQAYAVVAAAVLPKALKAVDDLRQENARLTQSLQAYLKSSGSTRPAASAEAPAPAGAANAVIAAIERYS